MANESRLKKIRIGWLSIWAILISFSYALARPATESLFLEAHTSKALPKVWLIGALSMFIAVVIYNRFISRIDLLKLFGYVCVVSALLLSILLLSLNTKISGLYYALYIWKDIYMVMLVEVYYSYTNSVFPIKTARWTYGLFGLIASLSAMAGNMVVGILAKKFGTFTTLWFVVPILLVSALSAIPFAKVAGIGHPIKDTISKKIIESLKVIEKSPYLFLILLLITVTQIVITLIDFQFNSFVEKAFPVLDVRTGIIGKVYASVTFGTLALNTLSGPILRIVGIPLTLIAIPFLLGTTLAAFVAIPRFLTVAILKASSKAFDYSIFRIAKESLYIPLTYAEKTVGKSFIDMFVYRAAKGLASLILLGLIAIKADTLAAFITVIMICIWLIITIFLSIKFRKITTREQEMFSDKVAL